MKEGGEVWSCDLSSFTARCFILKPLIYCFSPSAAVQVIRTGGGGEEAPTVQKTVSQTVWLQASLRSWAPVRAVLWHVRQGAPQGCHRNSCIASLIWRCVSSPTPPVHHEAMSREAKRGKKKCSQSGASNSRVVPASSLLHCYSLFLWRVGDSLWYNQRSRWFRWTVATSWQLSLLFFLFSFFKRLF